MIIAIDGPTAAGKGTLARRLARDLGYAYLDSGALYRAVALALRRAGLDGNDAPAAARAARALDATLLSDPALRDEETGALASKIAVLPEVRAALLDYQRRFAAHPPEGAKGAVLDGRDIGTVICPQADVKIFVTASPEIRAQRRHSELREKGEMVSFDQVLADLQIRDARDSARTEAPLRPAEDAHLLDTSDLAIDAALARVKAIVRATLA